MKAALHRTLGRDLPVRTVIDVGASNGVWTRLARRFLPEASYLLVEANSVHRPELQAYVASVSDTRYELVAAGAEDGAVYFDASDPLGGAASQEYQEGFLELPVRSIDSLVREHRLEPPYMLKLDTHGFEVPIFEGARHTLAQTNLIVVEVYNFRIQENSLLFHEMCDFLKEKGFRPIDLCDPLFRTYDNALWQMDLFFVRSERPEFEHRYYT